MPTFVLDPRDLGKDLETSYRGMIEETVATIQKTVALHAPKIALQVIAAVGVGTDRATYKRSFKTDKVTGGAVFYNFSPHGPIIEEGRRPGARMPSVDVILAWVKRKRIGAQIVGPVRSVRTYALSGGKIRTRAPGARKLAVEAQQRGIALAIARAIKARGMPAYHVLAITEKTLTPIVEDAVDLALAKL